MHGNISVGKSVNAIVKVTSFGWVGSVVESKTHDASRAEMVATKATTTRFQWTRFTLAEGSGSSGDAVYRAADSVSTTTGLKGLGISPPARTVHTLLSPS